MGEVERVVSELIEMLDRSQKEAEVSASVMDQLDIFLEQESNAIIRDNLSRLLSKIEKEAAKRAGRIVIVISPEDKIRIVETSGAVESDPYLMALKSRDFYVLTLSDFSSLIEALKSEVARPRRLSIIELLMANAEFVAPLLYLAAPPVGTAEKRHEKPNRSSWKLSDLLPAPPLHPPMPRGLFRGEGG